MTAQIEINDRFFPLVFVIFPSQASEAMVDDYAARLEATYKRGRFIGVSSIDNIIGSSPALRKRLASRIDDLTTRYPGTVACEAAIAKSAIVRGLFTAYSWIKSDKGYPSRCFGSFESAIVWAREEGAKVGLVVSADAHQLDSK